MDYEDLKKNIEEYIMSEFKNIYFEKDKMYRIRDILYNYREWRNSMYSEKDLIGGLFYRFREKDIIKLVEEYNLFIKVPNQINCIYKCNYISNSSSSTYKEVDGFV